MRTTYVYTIRNLSDGRWYIGISYDPIRRIKRHQTYHYPTKHIANAIRKDGIQNFEFAILKVCASREEACHLEQEAIALTRSYSDYNHTFGGDYPDVTDTARNSLSKATKAHFADPNNRERLSKTLKEHYADPSVRVAVGQAVSEAYAKNPEAKRKVSDASKKRWADPEYKERLRKKFKEAAARRKKG